MTMADHRRREIIRGKILHYLKLIYPEPATLPLLQGELDIFGYPVPMEDVKFHVAYLKEKGMLETDRVQPARTRVSVPLVKITAQGIDYLDGRLPFDDGIYLEPR